VAGGALAALVLLMGWWALASGRGDIGYASLRAPPDGLQRTLSLFMVHELRPPDRYVLARGALRVTVRGDPRELQLGEEWTVGGTFEQGELVEAWRAPAPGRPAKKALGFLGLFLAGAVGAAGVRVGPGGLVLRG
jgi:hypothetical protein